MFRGATLTCAKAEMPEESMNAVIINSAKLFRIFYSLGEPYLLRNIVRICFIDASQE
jgi:hypothetical protein